MSKKPPQMPGQGGSYVRDGKGALSQKEATKPADTLKAPAAAKPASGKKEA